MSAVLRISLIGVVGRSSRTLTKAATPALTQTCGIAGKIIRETEKWVRPKPYPYKEKDYGFLNAVFDKTTQRFNDNSKVNHHSSFSHDRVSKS